jgi:hypothetical protein
MHGQKQMDYFEAQLQKSHRAGDVINIDSLRHTTLQQQSGPRRIMPMAPLHSPARFAPPKRGAPGAGELRVKSRGGLGSRGNKIPHMITAGSNASSNRCLSEGSNRGSSLVAAGISSLDQQQLQPVAVSPSQRPRASRGPTFERPSQPLPPRPRTLKPDLSSGSANQRLCSSRGLPSLSISQPLPPSNGCRLISLSLDREGDTRYRNLNIPPLHID